MNPPFPFLDTVLPRLARHLQLGLIHESNQYYHWHYARGLTTVASFGQLRSDGQKFIAATGFVDGHAAQHDFTKALTADPYYPIEPTPQWIWYKPKD